MTANWPITPAISDCLFTAVSTDTGSFQYPSTTPATYHVAGELVKRGANLEKICDEHERSLTARDMAATSELDFQFHRELTRASHNELLLAMLDKSGIPTESLGDSNGNPRRLRDGLGRCGVQLLLLPEPWQRARSHRPGQSEDDQDAD